MSVKMSEAKKMANQSPTHAAADLRTTLEWLKSEGDLIETDHEVDPDLEIIGLQKHLDGSCPMMFNNVKGKPNHRVIANLFGDIKVINKIFGWADDQDRTIKLAHALTHPLTPVEISPDEAPCQQVVVDSRFPNEVGHVPHRAQPPVQRGRAVAHDGHGRPAVPGGRPFHEQGEEHVMGYDRDALDLGDRAETVQHEVDHGARPNGQEMLRPAAGDGSQPRGPARGQYKCLHVRMVRPNRWT